MSVIKNFRCRRDCYGMRRKHPTPYCEFILDQTMVQTEYSGSAKMNDKG